MTWNLLSNAIKFSPKGSGIRVRLVEEEVGLRVSVTEMGTGIEADFLPLVFDRFGRTRAAISDS